jgi:hypothetical protein
MVIAPTVGRDLLCKRPRNIAGVNVVSELLMGIAHCGCAITFGVLAYRVGRMEGFPPTYLVITACSRGLTTLASGM